ncbi:hypothetical protein FOZ63_018962 [Perkinsus olseni]|uniref:Uncharacterized protein n=1 Tax=Perkinsus olseni TaxID=32597 RepID=A0A7J6S1H3_PEROL|nr:hypothetical protein FOZ62_013161 [Perkinsus olseni]KAF4726376.1 hypothetical protein FOZ63_018962 [Perkinsus olseni]
MMPIGMLQNSACYEVARLNSRGYYIYMVVDKHLSYAALLSVSESFKFGYCPSTLCSARKKRAMWSVIGLCPSTLLAVSFDSSSCCVLEADLIVMTCFSRRIVNRGQDTLYTMNSRRRVCVCMIILLIESIKQL